jgi:hypothetical protein
MVRRLPHAGGTPHAGGPPCRRRPSPSGTAVWAAALLVTAALAPSAVDAAGGDRGTGAVVRVASHKPAMPPSCGSNGERCEQELTLSSGGKIATLANFALAGSPEVTHALIVVHGTGRNPESAFTSVLGGADKAGVTGSTLVVAPHFKASEDHPSRGEVAWSKDGWKQGDAAVSPKGGPSSFAVLDEILTMLASRQRFPQLRWITVVGHSAGAQFTQRYAAFGQAPDAVPGVTVNYVIGNSSSYVYFDDERPSAEGGGFSRPSGGCPDYDEYKYGMRGRTGYAARLTPDQALATYASRRVTILNGGEDTFDNGDMDTDCAANLQGANRAVRGQRFFERIRQERPDAPHDRIVVPGVDHDKFGLFSSPLARGVLFGTTESPRSSG